MMEVKKIKKFKTGVVVSTAMDKTVVVSVMRAVMDPVFKKYVRRRSKFMVHDENDKCSVGDQVLIVECRPLSKRKRWRVANILKHEELPEEIQ